MPAKDRYHDTVKTALIKDQWTVDDKAFKLEVGKRDLFVDLGAEKLLIAQRATRKIAVEVKSFIGASPVNDLEQALGQYLLYEKIMQREHPDRILYLAVRETVYTSFFQEEIVQIFLETGSPKLLIFDEIQEEIVQWLPSI
jgi:XisH protein